MKRPFFLAVAVAFGVGIAFLAASPLAANHAWGSYHWARTSNPFTLKVGDNVSSAWDAYLDEAIADWSTSSVLDVTKAVGGTNPKNCRPTSGRIEVCSNRYGNNGWLGLAQIWVSGSHIVQGVNKLNDYYFNMPTYNTPAYRRLVVCQELAHTLGLDHQDENQTNSNLGSCMDYTRDPDGPPSNEHPDQHDFEQLETIYAHLDSTTTADATATSRGNSGADNPSEWGQTVRLSHDGRAVLYELDLGGGNKVFTFVIWAD